MTDKNSRHQHNGEKNEVYAHIFVEFILLKAISD